MSNTPVAVVLAAYHPPMDLLKKQVATILAQEKVSVRLWILADGPMPQLPELRNLAAGDDRIILVEQPNNLGSTETFLAGVESLCTDEWFTKNQALLAFADQDDEWDPDRISATAENILSGMSDGVHSDARLINVDGQSIYPSLFVYGAKKRDPTIVELVFRNNATGMAMTLSHEAARELAALRIVRPSDWIHDHLAAFVAATGKGLTFVERPLVSYRQHGENQIGAGTYREQAVPTFAFLGKDSKPAGTLRELRRFLVEFGNRDWASDSAREELCDVRRAISPYGVAGFARTVSFVGKVPMHRSMKARLLLEAGFPPSRTYR